MNSLRIVSVVPSFNCGGIGTVCRYACEGLAREQNWKVTLLSLHDPEGTQHEPATGVRLKSLGLSGDCAVRFIEWLRRDPHDVLITNDVSQIESAFPFIPSRTVHIVSVHDSLRRYRLVPVRYAQEIDGVLCVAQHIESAIKPVLADRGFKGLIQTVHNGAHFPPPFNRQITEGPLRLLFMGRVEPLKGVFDLAPLLKKLKKLRVPFRLTLVGGQNEKLKRKFQRAGVADHVTWVGHVPHSQCFRIAAESDILLMLSRKEPFGMVTVEAMAMGAVPFAYDAPSGTTEIITNGKGGVLIPLGNIQALGSAIQSLHLRRDRLLELSTSAMREARLRFNANVMSTRTGQFIKNVVAHSITCPAERATGMPLPKRPAVQQYLNPYQVLPAWFRSWARDRVCAHPRLCHWLLSR